jgi:hypothetical protein
MWLGLCVGPTCGEMVIRSSREDEEELRIADFLAVQTPRRYQKPWIRLFRRVTALAGMAPLRSSEAPCFSCEESDLVMQIPLMGVDRLHDAVLCLMCGAVRVRCTAVDWGGPCNIYGGVDWLGPDEAVTLLRRGIRSLEAREQSDDSFGWSLE